MTDADEDLMRTLRSQGMSPDGAAEQINQRITARNVQTLND